MIFISNIQGNSFQQLNSHVKSRLALFRFFLISPPEPPPNPMPSRKIKKGYDYIGTTILAINIFCRIHVTSRLSLFLISPPIPPTHPEAKREDRKKLHRAAAPWCSI
jgi:hypothetical protein